MLTLASISVPAAEAVYGADGQPINPIAVPVVIPGRHDVPGVIPATCFHCREPIRGIPARTDDHRTFHTACLIRARTR